MAESVPLIAVVEDLKLKNMTKKPKPKQDAETGRWLANGASAKAGLNKVILGANIGQIFNFANYKLKAKGKLLIKVNPKHTSQECSECGYTHADNRKTQAGFSCQQCGHTENADANAAKIIKKRGLKHIRSEAFSKEKTVRKITARLGYKAQEPASLGDGGRVRLSVPKAMSDDVLNSMQSENASCLLRNCSVRSSVL